MSGSGKQGEAERHGGESHLHQPAFAKPLDQRAHATSLNQSADQTGERKNISDFFGAKRHAVVREPAFGKEREAGVQCAERQREGEELP